MYIYLVKVNRNVEPYYFTNLSKLWNYLSEVQSITITVKIPISYSTLARQFKNKEKYKYGSVNCEISIHRIYKHVSDSSIDNNL